MEEPGAISNVWHASITNWLLAPKMQSWSQDNSRAWFVWRTAAKVAGFIAIGTSGFDGAVNFFLATGRVVRDGCYELYEMLRGRWAQKHRHDLHPWYPGKHLLSRAYYGYTLECIGAALKGARNLWNTPAYLESLAAPPVATQIDQQWAELHATVPAFGAIRDFVQGLPEGLRLTRATSQALLLECFHNFHAFKDETGGCALAKLSTHLAPGSAEAVATLLSQSERSLYERADLLDQYNAFLSKLGVPPVAIPPLPAAEEELRSKNFQQVIDLLGSSNCSMLLLMRAFELARHQADPGVAYEAIWEKRAQLMALIPQPLETTQLISPWLRLALRLVERGQWQKVLQMQALLQRICGIREEASGSILTQLLKQRWHLFSQVGNAASAQKKQQVFLALIPYFTLAQLLHLPLAQPPALTAFIQHTLCRLDFQTPPHQHALFLYADSFASESDLQKIWQGLFTRLKQAQVAQAADEGNSVKEILVKICQTEKQFRQLSEFLGTDEGRALAEMNVQLHRDMLPHLKEWDNLSGSLLNALAGQLRRFLAVHPAELQRCAEAFKECGQLRTKLYDLLFAVQTPLDFKMTLQLLPTLQESVAAEIKDPGQAITDHWSSLFGAATALLYRCETPHSFDLLLTALVEWSNPMPIEAKVALEGEARKFFADLQLMRTRWPGALTYAADASYPKSSEERIKQLESLWLSS